MNERIDVQPFFYLFVYFYKFLNQNIFGQSLYDSYFKTVYLVV